MHNRRGRCCPREGTYAIREVVRPLRRSVARAQRQNRQSHLLGWLVRRARIFQACGCCPTCGISRAVELTFSGRNGWSPIGQTPAPQVGLSKWVCPESLSDCPGGAAPTHYRASPDNLVSVAPIDLCFPPPPGTYPLRGPCLKWARDALGARGEETVTTHDSGKRRKLSNGVVGSAGRFYWSGSRNQY
jgi:hypothetical protein